MLFSLSLGSLLACSQSTPNATPEPTASSAATSSKATDANAANSAAVGAETTGAQATSSEWQRVSDRSQVCMINNQVFDAPQIPVEVDGKTYFGCCEMCKGKLGGDPSSRVARDPQSGNEVDKATAIIAKNSKRQVHYFESEASFAAYAAAHAQ